MINSNLEQADGKSIVLIFMLFGIPRYTLISLEFLLKMMFPVIIIAIVFVMIIVKRISIVNILKG
jgi:hypothetical protein